jgi:WD40 repeat protein/serine/threonine protein kinase/class 3 adenylate cyclase
MSNQIDTPRAAPTERSRVLTIVFTNLSGSAELKGRLGDRAAAERIARHEELLRKAAAEASGYIVHRAGDSFLLRFATPSEAVTFSLLLQQAHGADADLPRVRIGIHMGEITEIRDPAVSESGIELAGFAVDLGSRIQALALPGQVLLSYMVFENARQRLSGSGKFERLAWRSHGRYLFKGHDRPLAIFEVGIEGHAPLAPPLDHEKARHVPDSDSSDTAVRWRPAPGIDLPRRKNWALEKKLGGGGGGEVWLAVQRGTGERRVLKFCFDHQQLRSLQREVTVFRLLKETLGDRPDIARIMDWQFDHAPFYLEFEYVGGLALPDWAHESGGLDKVPLSTRLEIVARVADAISAAHSVGILHKDIKPSNILVTGLPNQPPARVTVIDFGIGVVTDQELLAAKGITALGMTQLPSDGYTSHSGTRLYMAPELLEGQPITISSDVYSLGVMLYQMITGNLQHAIATGWQRDIEDELLRQDVAACVDGQPDRRLASAAELARRLRNLEERRREYLIEQQREAEAARLQQVATHARMRNRVLGVGLIALLILLISSVVIAVQARNRARLQSLLKMRETSARLDAVRHKEFAERANNEALARGMESERLRQLAETEQYFANIGFADANLRQGRVSKARELLLTKTPERLRNWEWGYLVKHTSPDVMTLARYDSPGGALHAEYNPAGDRIATGDRDGQVTLYDAKTGRRLARAKPHRRFAWDVSWSRDGKFLAVASLDFSGSVLDASTLRVISMLRGSGDVLRGIDFSPDASRVATASADRSLRFWQASTGQVLQTIRHPEGILYDVHYSPDGSRVVTASLDNTVDVWDANTGERQRTIMTHTKAVHSATFSPDGKHILSSGSDRAARIFDSSTGEQIAVLDNPTDWVHCASYSPDGKRIATSDNSGICRVWDAETSRQLGMIQDGTQMYKVFFSPDGARLVTSNWDTIKVWDVEAVTNADHFADPPGTANLQRALAGSYEANTVICYPVERGRDWHDSDAFYNVPGGLTVFHVKDRTFVISSFFSSQDSHGTRQIVIDEKTMKASGRTMGAAPDPVPLGTGTIYSTAFSPDGKLAACGGYSNNVFIYDPSNWKLLRTIRNIGAPTAPVSCIKFSPDSKVVFAGSFDGYAGVYDLARGTTVSAMRAHVRPVITAAFSPDGTRIATGSTDKTARLFAVSSGEQLTTMTGHTSYVHGIAFSPDGKRILTCSEDDTVKLWESDSGREMFPVFDTHTEEIKLLAAGFTTDGRAVYSVTSKGTILIADAFPWKPSDYPVPSQAMEKRIELWKRMQSNPQVSLDDIDW